MFTFKLSFSEIFIFQNSVPKFLIGVCLMLSFSEG